MTYLFYFYAFLVPFQNVQEKIPKGPSGINYPNFMMLLMLAWWLFGRPGRGRRLIMRTPLNALLLVFMAWTYFGLLITTLTVPGAPSAIDPFGLSFTHFLQYFNSFLMFYFAANMIDSRRKIHRCVLALALASPLIFRYFYTQLHSMPTWHYSDALRVRGPFTWIGSNELGALLCYSAIFMGLYGLFARRLSQKIYFFLAAACYGYGVLYSYSRATQLAFACAMGLVAALRFRLVLVLMVVLALTWTVWVPNSVQQRWAMTETPEGQLEESAQGRKNFAQVAWDLFQKSPVVGNGVDSFKILSPYKMDTHDIFLRVLTEQGLIGFGLFMTIWAVILHMSFILWRRAGVPFDRYYGLCLLTATIGLMICNIFGDRFTHYAVTGQYWVLVGMGARLYAHLKGYEALVEDDFDQTLAAESGGQALAEGVGPSAPLAPAGAASGAGPASVATPGPLPLPAGRHAPRREAPTPVEWYQRPVLWLLQPLLPPVPRTVGAKTPAEPVAESPRLPKLNIVGQSQPPPPSREE